MTGDVVSRHKEGGGKAVCLSLCFWSHRRIEAIPMKDRVTQLVGQAETIPCGILNAGVEEKPTRVSWQLAVGGHDRIGSEVHGEHCGSRCLYVAREREQRAIGDPPDPANGFRREFRIWRTRFRDSGKPKGSVDVDVGKHAFNCDSSKLESAVGLTLQAPRLDTSRPMNRHGDRDRPSKEVGCNLDSRSEGADLLLARLSNTSLPTREISLVESSQISHFSLRETERLTGDAEKRRVKHAQSAVVAESDLRRCRSCITGAGAFGVKGRIFDSASVFTGSSQTARPWSR